MGWALLAAAGCEPALNWRDVPVGEARIQLPCRPVAQRRSIPLLGQEVSVQLQTCDAAGATWAALDVVAPAGQALALVSALDRALAANLEAHSDAVVTETQAVAAATSPAAAGASSAAIPGGAPLARHRVAGRRVDGSETLAEISYASRGDHVVQLVALFPREPDRALAAGLEHFHGSFEAGRR